MYRAIIGFFKKIHLIVTSRAYLLQMLKTDSLRRSFGFVFLFFLLSTFLSAAVRIPRVLEKAPQKFEEAFGVLEFTDGVITKGLDPSRTIIRRDLAELVSLVVGLEIEPNQVTKVILRTDEPEKLQETAVQVTPQALVYTKYKAFASAKEERDVYSYEEAKWEKETFPKGVVKLSATTVEKFLKEYPAHLLLSLWAVSSISLLYLLASHLLLLIIIVFFYSRNTPILKVAQVRPKLVLYLMSPIFILYPLFSIMTNGLEYVAGLALIAASVIMIRLFQLILLLNPPKEKADE